MAEAADFQGMTPSPARRRFRRTAALLAGAPLLAGLLQLPAAPAGAATPAAKTPEAPSAPAGTGSVDVSVDSMSPSTPTDDDTVTVSGKVTNEGRQTVTDAHVGLRVGPTLNNRSSVDNAAKRSDSLQGALGREVGGKDGKYTEEFDKIAPGATQNFRLSVPVKELDLSADGVYQLGVSLTGRSAAQPYAQVLGVERTFLPWQSEAPSEKTKVSFLWPLISRTHLTAETASDEQQTPVFADDKLAEEIAPGGRLEQMLSLGKDLPVTWVIDPDLLASLDAMATKGYNVENPDGGNPVPGSAKNRALAKQWLNKLQQAVKGKKVVALPFADPDLASLAHQGKAVGGSLSHLQPATDVAAETVKMVLHVEPSTDFAWPAEGAVDPSVVDVATSAGAHSVIARSDSLRESGALPYTPTAARPIGGGTTAVVADARLSTAFQGDMTRAENSTLAVQEFLAQSQMITLQDPDRQRSIVVAPQRMPTASQAQTMAQALGALDSESWTEPDDLISAAKATPDPKATTQVPGTGAYPANLRRQELPRAAFESVRTTQETLGRFKVILSEPDRVVTPFGRAMDRELSTSWRGRAHGAEAYRNSVQRYLTTLTGQVQLIEKTEAKLSGRSATIPITVQNNLVQGVENLTLRLTSTKPTRLKIGEQPGPYEEQPIKVSGGHSQTVKFTTTANANGPVPVVAQLYTEDGTPYGKEIRFDVDVTEITLTVMLVIAGGILLLVLAGFRMYTQRKAAARRAEEEEAEAENGENGENGDEDGGENGDGRKKGDGSPESGPPAPEQPSDPTPDTAPESTDPSGTGERVDR
ncbi:DUF6049 family protein [Streptomyces luteolus]|uniref:DUF6049 family protein n=1 Tax=Streptomyces luteolus TaxID=3043615 RepID=A0ABT6SYT2_9ACTN|nr:DUF6049 family protein [Streptomyces sp. B-S-A12]MDI3420556.1 DUF6049 family protein [Streptomyces sp. B-S-A12]